jgi:hypothetical protein
MAASTAACGTRLAHRRERTDQRTLFQGRHGQDGPVRRAAQGKPCMDPGPGRPDARRGRDRTRSAFHRHAPAALGEGRIVRQFALDRGLSRPVYEWPHYVGAYMLVNT